MNTLNPLVQSGQHRANSHTVRSLQDHTGHLPVLVWGILLCKLLRQCFVNLPDHVHNVLATLYHHKITCTKLEKAVVRFR